MSVRGHFFGVMELVVDRAALEGHGDKHKGKVSFSETQSRVPMAGEAPAGSSRLQSGRPYSHG